MAAFCSCFSMCFQAGPAATEYQQVSLDAVPLTAVTSDQHADLPDWEKFDNDMGDIAAVPVDAPNSDNDLTNVNDADNLDVSASFGPLSQSTRPAALPPKLPTPDVTTTSASPQPSPSMTKPKVPRPRKTKPKQAKPVEEEKPEIDYFSSLGMGPALNANDVVVTRVKRPQRKKQKSIPKNTPAPKPTPAPTPAPEPVQSSNRFAMDNLMGDDDGDADLDIDMADLDLGDDLDDSDVDLDIDGILNFGDDNVDETKEEEPAVEVSSIGTKRKPRKPRKKRAKKSILSATAM